MSDVFSNPRESLDYPLEFDLRLIAETDYVQELPQALRAICLELAVLNGEPSKPEQASAKYSRFSCPVKVLNPQGMQELYARVAALRGVKMVL